MSTAQAPLSVKDSNTHMQSPGRHADGPKELKTLEEHRRVLKNKLEAEGSKHMNYISPSDNIMSPCTAKLSALRSNRNSRVKPRSLFAQASAKKLGPNGGGSLGGPKSASDSATATAPADSF